jgi:hypothetical protein
MPLQPHLGQVHVDRPLTNISVAYIQDESAFVSTRHAVVPSDKKSNVYFLYTQNDFLRDEAKPRGPNEESAGSGYNVSNTSFSCQVYALHKDVDEQVRMNTDDPLDAKRDAIKFITRKLLIRQERQFMTDIMTSGPVWTGSSTATDLTANPTWDDPTSTPIEDVQVQQAQILSQTGFLPNVFYLGFQTYQKLIRHPDVIDLIKYGASAGAPAIANEEALAKIFGVEEVIVSKAMYATNAENATAAYSLMASKNALLLYVPSSPGLYTPSSFYTFMWTGVSYGLGLTIGAYEIPMPWLGLTTVRVEAQIAFVNKIVGATLGAYWTSAVA